MLYGHGPRHFGIEETDSCTVQDLDPWLKERQGMAELLRQHLLRVQQRMKNQADKHRTERSFAVGDWVCLKLQPYVQNLVVSQSCHKLSFRFFDPYQVEAKVGTATYRLKLPPTSNVHPIFHVSLLKKVTGTHRPLVSDLPNDTSVVHLPELVLDKHLKNRDNRVIAQVLVKWTGLPVEMATWEDEDEINRQMPGVDSTAYGEAMKSGGGDVTTGAVATGATGEEAGARPKRVTRPSVLVNGPD